MTAPPERVSAWIVGEPLDDADETGPWRVRDETWREWTGQLFLVPDPGGEAGARIRRTLEVLAAPRTCVSRVLEWGERDGRLWVVTSDAKGDTLARHAQRRPLQGPEAARVFLELARALDDLHHHGVRGLLPTGSVRYDPEAGLQATLVPGRRAAGGRREDDGTESDVRAFGGLLLQALLGRPGGHEGLAHRDDVPPALARLARALTPGAPDPVRGVHGLVEALAAANGPADTTDPWLEDVAPPPAPVRAPPWLYYGAAAVLAVTSVVLYLHPPDEPPAEPIHGASVALATPEEAGVAFPDETGAAEGRGAPARAKARHEDEAVPLVMEPPRRLPDGTIVRDVALSSAEGLSGELRMGGIRGDHVVDLDIPEAWQVLADPELHFELHHAPELDAEVSTMLVTVDGQPAASFPLSGDPDSTRDQVARAVGARGPGRHEVRFSAYNRSQLPCEATAGDALWSSVGEGAFARVRYRRVAPALDLARWPLPLVDARDPEPLRVVVALPPGPTSGELLAAAHVAASLGRAAGERALDVVVHEGSLATAPEGDVVAIAGRPSRGAAPEIAARLAADADPDTRAAGAELGEGRLAGAGLVALLRRAEDPTRTVVALVGADDAGAVALGRVLSDREAARLARGRVARVADFDPPAPAEPRRWNDTIPEAEAFTLADLGLADLRASGPRGGTVEIPLRMVPDERPSPGEARFDLAYSYAPGVDPEASRLVVWLNREQVASVPLAADGASHDRITLDLPVHRMGPDSRLRVGFDLRSRAGDACPGAPEPPLWGTVHADSSIRMPRGRWGDVHDLSLLRMGGFPFGVRPDLSDTDFVVPARPTAGQLRVLLALAGELGRVGRGDRFAFGLRRGPVEAGTDRDLVVVGSERDVAFATEPASDTILPSAHAAGRGAALVLREAPLPWSHARTALLAAVQGDDEALAAVLSCTTPLFARLRGDAARLSSCDAADALAGRDAPLSGELPVESGLERVLRRTYWLILAGATALMVAGLFVRHQLRDARRIRRARLAEEIP